MTNELNSSYPVAAASGWHVHYIANGRVRVQLACNQDAAIDFARTLFSENRHVLRLMKYDGSATMSQAQIKHLVTLREPQLAEGVA